LSRHALEFPSGDSIFTSQASLMARRSSSDIGFEPDVDEAPPDDELRAAIE
jgi:hypothetical protein